MIQAITDSVIYIGVDDTDLDLFEGQYVIPEGISYNSYVILDEKVAIMDTVDKSKMAEWEQNLKEALNGREADYLVIHHLEPDHAGCIMRLIELFPEIRLVGNKKTFQMMQQMLGFNPAEKAYLVEENDVLSLGAHTLKFMMAPMVHWPEVMVSYESKDKILFSADAFGKFGALSETKDDDWACEARRYYFNIVGKFGAAVQLLLKKINGLDIETICSLHGPVLNKNISYYTNLYDIWSRYEPEDSGIIIAYVSFHGNTKEVANEIAKRLIEQGERYVVTYDLARADIAEVIEDAFRYDRMILASPTYDGGVAPCMQMFLYQLKSKAYQNRKVGVVENGSWAPIAGMQMRNALKEMKNITIVEPTVSICSTLKEDDFKQLEELVQAIKG